MLTFQSAQTLFKHIHYWALFSICHELVGQVFNNAKKPITPSVEVGVGFLMLAVGPWAKGAISVVCSQFMTDSKVRMTSEYLSTLLCLNQQRLCSYIIYWSNKILIKKPYMGLKVTRTFVPYTMPYIMASAKYCLRQPERAVSFNQAKTLTFIFSNQG